MAINSPQLLPPYNDLKPYFLHSAPGYTVTHAHPLSAFGFRMEFRNVLERLKKKSRVAWAFARGIYYKTSNILCMLGTTIVHIWGRGLRAAQYLPGVVA